MMILMIPVRPRMMVVVTTINRTTRCTCTTSGSICTVFPSSIGTTLQRRMRRKIHRPMVVVVVVICTRRMHNSKVSVVAMQMMMIAMLSFS
jgi:hypothetical protein